MVTAGSGRIRPSRPPLVGSAGVPDSTWGTRDPRGACHHGSVDPDRAVVGQTDGGASVLVARPDDVPCVQALLSAAVHRVAALGYQQWWDPFPVETIEDSVRRGETYLALDEGMVVGTIAVQWDDPTYWGVRPPDAGYVHRLCTAARVARPGLGVELLSWAASMASDRGRGWIRLDTPAANARLCSYYESLGFRHRGETDVTVKGASDTPERWRCALYERSTRTPFPGN